MDLKKEIKTEQEKMKQMSGRDLIWYIWEYYKFHILAIALTVMAVWLIAVTVYRQSFSTRLSLAVINDRSGGAGSLNDLEDELCQALGCGKKERIDLNEGLFISYDEESMSQYSYASMAKISALVSGNALDIMIADGQTLEHYSQLSAFEDLKTLLTPKQLKALEDHLFYTESESGEKTAVGLSLDSSFFEEKTGILMEPPYLAVITSSPHTEDILRTIDWLFDLQP